MANAHAGKEKSLSFECHVYMTTGTDEGGHVANQTHHGQAQFLAEVDLLPHGAKRDLLWRGDNDCTLGPGIHQHSHHCQMLVRCPWRCVLKPCSPVNNVHERGIHGMSVNGCWHSYQ